MNLCEFNHDEICFEGRLCPACGLKDQIADLEEKITELRDQIKEKDQEIEALQP